MYSTYILVILLAAVSCINSIELIQPKTTDVKPGESVTLNCKISGYSVTTYGYCTHWIRQPAGKALEWVARICWDGGTAYSEKLKSRFQVSRDTSSNSVSLRGQNMQSEDTAVYYCARGGGYFDYWGKGTQVTVTSETVKAPQSVFPVWQCDQSSNFVSIGCLSRGLTSPDATFSWKDSKQNAVSDFTQYPAVRENGGYTVVSHMQVKASDWNDDKAFTCTVKNSVGQLDGTVKKPGPVNRQPASLLLTISDRADNVTLICLAKQFSPTDSFKWNRNKNDVTKQSSTMTSSENKRIAFSTLELTQEEWSMTTSVECLLMMKNGTVIAKTRHDPDTVEPDMKIVQPSFKDILINKSADLECIANGPEGFLSMTWMIGNKNISAVVAESDATTLRLVTPISYDDWTKGIEYTCELEHRSFPQGSKTLSFQRKSGTKHQPSVYLLSPAEKKGDKVTLTCYVKDFSPMEIVVSWLADDESVDDNDDYSQKTTNVIENHHRFSVYSQLIVPIGEWDKGVVYSCRVYHEAIDENVYLITRTIDSKSNTPTLVNINLNPKVSKMLPAY